MTFQLDTTGVVGGDMWAAKPVLGTTWSDLSPFTQGYVEALLQPSEGIHYSLTDRFAGFSDLAPETLARIIADCDWFCTDASSRRGSPEAGGECWRLRQAGKMAHVEPLTVQLGDGGKVRFA